MKKPIKRVAAIHDLCGIGKAALTNIIPVLSIMEIEVCPIPTMILTTHTGGFGVPSINNLKDYLYNASKHYEKLQMQFEGIFVGYLGSIKNIEESINFLKTFKNDNSIIILDPIFGDNENYYSNFNKNYSDSLRQIVKFSKIITPNYTEACILCEENILKEAEYIDVIRVCRKLHILGCENIIITSVPLKNKNLIGTAVYNGKCDHLTILENYRQAQNYPGTGDIFSSVLIGELVNGKNLLDSAKKSCEFVEKCIKVSNQFEYPTKEGVLLEKCLKYLI